MSETNIIQYIYSLDVVVCWSFCWSFVGRFLLQKSIKFLMIKDLQTYFVGRFLGRLLVTCLSHKNPIAIFTDNNGFHLNYVMKNYSCPM